MKKLNLIITLLIFNSYIFATGEIGDLYFYKVTPGKYQEARDLLEEGRKIGEETDMNVIIHAQSFGRGGEQVLSWFEIYDDYAQRAKTRYTSDKWDAYIEKFNKSDALVATKSYQMISLDPIVPDDYIVTNYMWQPNKGKRQDTLDALERAKVMFERHGFIVDLWEHNAGSKHALQFTFLSTSIEEQAESFASLATDEDWLKERDKWFNGDWAKLVDSFEMTNTNLRN
jgi:hypothetical protein